MGCTKGEEVGSTEGRRWAVLRGGEVGVPREGEREGGSPCRPS